MPAAPSRPTRVCLFTDTLGDVNGVCRFLRALNGHAQDQHLPLTILTASRRTSPQLRGAQCLVAPLAMAMPGYPQLELAMPPLGRLLAAARTARPDVIHLSTPGPVGLAGLWIARTLGVPAAGTYHTAFPAFIEALWDDAVLGRIAQRVLERFYMRQALVLARSDAGAAWIEDLGVPRGRIRTLIAGCDHRLFNPARADPTIWSRLGSKRSKVRSTVRVLCCGRVSVEKNLPMLTRVWRALSARWPADQPRAELVVVGDGPWLGAMRRALAGSPALFLGVRHSTELATIYASSDLLAFPSVTDTLGQVVLEAQSSGLPAIVSTVGGPSSIVEHGTTGLAVSTRDEHAWIEALAALIDDPDRRRDMGIEAAKRQQGRTAEASCDHFWTLHKQLHEQLAPIRQPGPGWPAGRPG